MKWVFSCWRNVILSTRDMSMMSLFCLPAPTT